MEALWALAAGEAPPTQSFELLAATLAEGDQPDDSEAAALTRAADETRPLALKNTIDQSVAAATHFPPSAILS
eukprot:6338215-Pyramimonas_sp.AAC.1